MTLVYGTIAVINVILLGKAELCVVRMICGLPCPGCGLTHSTIALIKGHVTESFLYCPFTVFLLATVASGIICHFKPNLLPRPLFPIARFLAYNRRWHLIMAIAFLILYIVRFILFFPNGPYPMVYSSQNYLSLTCRILSGMLDKLRSF